METNLLGNKKIKFCLYARKSTERDELQALSIDSQSKEMLAVADKDGLEVADIRKESHSAKNSSERPVFMSIIKDIRADNIQGILTWAPDRLSRNTGWPRVDRGFNGSRTSEGNPNARASFYKFVKR